MTKKKNIISSLPPMKKLDYPNLNINLREFEKNQESLTETFQKFADYFKENQITRNTFVNNLPKSTTIGRQQSIRNINDAYQKDKLVLVLGAGVSLEFGVPSWGLLLQNLMVHTIKEENNV